MGGEWVAVLVDGRNVGMVARRLGVQVVYQAFMRWVVNGGVRGKSGDVMMGKHPRWVRMARVYLGPTESETNGLRAFKRAVQEAGFDVRICAEEGNSSKTAVDRDIIIDGLILAIGGRIDRLILVSGDGGFTRFVEIVRGYGVIVEVCFFGSRASRALVEAADRFWDLERVTGVTAMRVVGVPD